MANAKISRCERAPRQPSLRQKKRGHTLSRFIYCPSLNLQDFFFQILVQVNVLPQELNGNICHIRLSEMGRTPYSLDFCENRAPFPISPGTGHLNCLSRFILTFAIQAECSTAQGNVEKRRILQCDFESERPFHPRAHTVKQPQVIGTQVRKFTYLQRLNRLGRMQSTIIYGFNQFPRETMPNVPVNLSFQMRDVNVFRYRIF